MRYDKDVLFEPYLTYLNHKDRIPFRLGEFSKRTLWVIRVIVPQEILVDLCDVVPVYLIIYVNTIYIYICPSLHTIEIRNENPATTKVIMEAYIITGGPRMRIVTKSVVWKWFRTESDLSVNKTNVMW